MLGPAPRHSTKIRPPRQPAHQGVDQGMNRGVGYRGTGWAGRATRGKCWAQHSTRKSSTAPVNEICAPQEAPRPRNSRDSLLTHQPLPPSSAPHAASAPHGTELNPYPNRKPLPSPEPLINPHPHPNPNPYPNLQAPSVRTSRKQCIASRYFTDVPDVIIMRRRTCHCFGGGGLGHVTDLHL